MAIIFGLASILAISPALAFALMRLPLDPPVLAQGLALFVVMPTSISSCVLMTSEAKGNVALALLFSVSTNLAAVGTVPFFLANILASDSVEGGSALDPVDLLVKLALTIMLPLVVGKAFTFWRPAAAFFSKHKMALKLTSSALLISVPWITMSQSAARLRTTPIGSVFAVLGLGIALHVLLLLFNYGVTHFLPIALPERKAVVLCASQKTVTTALSVLQFVPPELADRGLLMLPILLSHFAQTIMDAIIAAKWKSVTDAPRPAGRTSTESSVPAEETHDMQFVPIMPTSDAEGGTLSSMDSVAVSAGTVASVTHSHSAPNLNTSFKPAPLAERGQSTGLFTP